jgi:hypothetical protein
MAFSLIANTAVAAGAGGNSGTTGSVDTTGADLLVAYVASWTNLPDAAVTDSKGNTWTPRTNYDQNGVSRSRILYVENPTVGTGHTFTVTSTQDFPVLCIQAWSGAATSSVYDTENGNGVTAGTSTTTGSVTPAQDDSLIVTGICFTASNTMSINSSFTISNQIDYAGATNFGGGMAYLVQTSATAVNPTWSWSSANSDSAASIAVFKVSGGAPADNNGYFFRMF